MINILINEQTYLFPSKWSELNIKQFQAINKLQLNEHLDALISIIHILTGITEAELDDLSYTEFLKISDCCKFIFDKEAFNEKIRYEVNIDDVRYVMAQDLTKISTREFIDLDTLLKNKDNVIENIHIVIAILFRPVGTNGLPEPYTTDTVYDRAELFLEKFPCDLILSIMSFGLALGQVSLDYLVDSLAKQASLTESKVKN